MCLNLKRCLSTLLNQGLEPEESERKKVTKQNRRAAFGTMNHFRFSILQLMKMNENPCYWWLKMKWSTTEKELCGDVLHNWIPLTGKKYVYFPASSCFFFILTRIWRICPYSERHGNVWFPFCIPRNHQPSCQCRPGPSEQIYTSSYKKQPGHLTKC